MAIDVETVCTDAQIDTHLGGKLTASVNLLPTAWEGTALPARAEALRRTLLSLSRRTPPIRESDISDPTELHDAVLFGSISHMFDAQITSGAESEVLYLQARNYEKRFERELASLVITGPASERIVSRAPSISRC